jgi:hypothetical protein
MSNITLIVGLPCSGKSTYAKNSRFLNYTYFDDPFYHYQLPEEFIDDTYAWTLINCLARSRDILVSDPHLCNTNARHQFIGWIIEHSLNLPKLELLFFENNLEQCLKNSTLNPDKPVQSYIKHLSKHYHIPIYYSTLPVFNA